jgi:methionyl-tRNA formyltransferase
LNLVFFGTPQLAVPTLARLLEGPHRVAAVVTQPDRPRGRGRQRSPAPVAERALAAGVLLLRPERVGAPDVVGALRGLSLDLGVVVAFGQFLPKAIRELPRLGYLINAHASLLPRHRGAAPIAHALLAGDPETGISIMRVEREMDAGAVCLTKRCAIGADDSCGDLEQRLAELAAEAVAEALDAIAAERAHFVAQDESRATLAPKLSAEAALLDFSRPAAELARRVRALAPKPGAAAQLGAERLRILAAHAEPGPQGRAPGAVDRASGALRVATGEGWLVLDRLQRAGGRPLSTQEFLRGFALPEGAHFTRTTPSGGPHAAAD